MEIVGFWGYVVVEALVVAGVLAVYLNIKNQRLRAQLAKVEGAEGSPALDIDGYSDLINKEILKTEAKLAQLADDPEAKAELAQTIQTRLTFLRAEREAASHDASSGETFWTQMTELLSACLPAPSDTDQTGQEDQSTLIDALQERVQAYEKRISNLEQFKQLFFDLKMKQSNSKDLNEKIRAEVDKAIPEQEQAPELKGVLAKLRDDNRTLEDQLSHIEHELDGVLRAAGAMGEQQTEPGQVMASSGSGVHADLDNDVENIRRLISQYKKHVNNLNGLVMNLKLDVRDKERLESTCEQLNAQHEDLQKVMHSLEEENDFLQEQISALLKQELEKEAQIQADAADVKDRLETQLKTYTELEGKYAEMEQLYLKTYQENQRLSEAAGSS